MEQPIKGGAKGAYDDKGRPLASVGNVAAQSEGTIIYEDKTGGIPAAAGVGGGGAAVYSDQGIKSGPQFEAGQLASGEGLGKPGDHEMVYDDHGQHVQGTAGYAGVTPANPVHDNILRKPGLAATPLATPLPGDESPVVQPGHTGAVGSAPGIVVNEPRPFSEGITTSGGFVAPAATPGAGAPGRAPLADRAKERTAGVVHQAQEKLGQLKERLARSQGTHEPTNPTPAGTTTKETLVYAPAAGHPAGSAGGPVLPGSVTSQPAAPASLGHKEKKPLGERLKESAVKGIDKVQAALEQANERVTGIK
eukprot:jgi/Botrbrau1/17753/Bobra.0127s0013.2